MKVMFLDIDGVLNSHRYDMSRSEADGNIDVSRLALVKTLVDRTGAEIVLTSTWREHWDPKGADTDAVGAELEATLARCGLRLYDKTPVIGERAQEITAWLGQNTDVEKYVIFDDIKLGWGELADAVITTDYRIGRGLEPTHIERAAEKLK